MGFIAWIIVGAIAGFLANMVMGSREGTSVFKIGSVNGINIESIVIATLGAILVVFVVNALRGGNRLGRSAS